MVKPPSRSGKTTKSGGRGGGGGKIGGEHRGNIGKTNREWG